MKPRKIKSKTRYLLAFTIGTFLFALGFLITHSIAYFEFQRISNLQDPISYQIFQDRLQYTLFGKDICDNEAYLKLSRELNFQGQIIGDLETKMGKWNKDVLFRKKFYTLIQIEHFAFIKQINEECGKNINTLLFFYSNEEDEIENAEKMGNILGPVYERNKERVVLYSLDLNLDSELIRSLKEKYDIKESSVILLNEEIKFEQVSNINDIETYLK
jgi:hypothetical protein